MIISDLTNEKLAEYVQEIQRAFTSGIVIDHDTLEEFELPFSVGFPDDSEVAPYVARHGDAFISAIFFEAAKRFAFHISVNGS